MGDKNLHLKEICKFTLNYFFIEDVVLVLIVKNVMKNEKFYFASYLCEIRKKCQERKLFVSKSSENDLSTIFS